MAQSTKKTFTRTLQDLDQLANSEFIRGKKFDDFSMSKKEDKILKFYSVAALTPYIDSNGVNYDIRSLTNRLSDLIHKIRIIEYLLFL